MTSNLPKILLGVTVSESLKLMNGLPEFLASKGWLVVVVASWESGQIPNSTPAIKYVNIKMSRTPKPIQDIFSLFRWLYLINKESPEVVFCGTPKAGMLGIAASWLRKTPVRIYHLRGLRLETSTGIARKMYRLIEKLVIGLSTSTLCVSPSLKKAIISDGLGSEKKLFVIGKGSSNGIDIQEFGNQNNSSAEIFEFSQNIGLNQNLPIIGFVGRLTADKGIFDLISAHEILIANGIPNQLLLIGKTENLLEAEKIDGLIQDNHLIFCPGLIQKPQIAFNAMTIFCLPTYREGFPNVVLEAGLSKLPTVTSDATGAVDSVINEETGLIYEKGQIKELANCLERLIKEPLFATQMGHNAFKFVSLNFQRTKFWEQLQSFLMEEFHNSKASK